MSERAELERQAELEANKFLRGIYLRACKEGWIDILDLLEEGIRLMPLGTEIRANWVVRACKAIGPKE